MRGQYAIALLLVLALAPAACGQRHGGGHGGPPGPGSAPMRPAMAGGPRAAMGNPGINTVPSNRFFVSGSRSGFHGGFHSGFRPGFKHGGRFHNRGFAPFVPWGGYYYMPYVDYDAQAQADYEAQLAEARAQQNAAEDQLRRQELQRTIDDLKDYNERRDRELEQERRDREEAASQPQAPQDPVILVFKDGHRAEVYNYAIMGDTFYDLSGGRSRKIPLAELDLDATTKVNEENGMTFRLPSGRNPA